MLPDLFAYTWVLWLVITVAAVVLELVTLSLVFAMIAVGSLVGGLGTWLLGSPAWLQVVAAAVLSGLLVFIIRPLLYRLLIRGRPRELTNVDALAGMTARATAPFRGGTGYARLDNGETWTARLAEDHEEDPVEAGARLVVVGIRGATAVVTPAPQRVPGSAGEGSIR